MPHRGLLNVVTHRTTSPQALNGGSGEDVDASFPLGDWREFRARLVSSQCEEVGHWLGVDNSDHNLIITTIRMVRVFEVDSLIIGLVPGAAPGWYRTRWHTIRGSIP